MHKYVKFMKDLLTNKKKLGETSTIILSEECSAILQNKLPRKLKDLDRFTIPCVIEDLVEDSVLADLGTSINVMPYKIFTKLGIGERTLTKMTIQLADRSIRHPRGIVDDVFVKVDKFIFLVDLLYLLSMKR